MAKIRPDLGPTETGPGHNVPRLRAVPGSGGLDEKQTLEYCLFCGTPQAGRASPSCVLCASPLPARDNGEPLPQPTLTVPARQAASIRRGLALDIHARWPLIEPVTATLQRLLPDRLEFTAPCAFVAEQLLKIDAAGLRVLAQVIACRPAAPERFLTTVSCRSILIEEQA